MPDMFINYTDSKLMGIQFTRGDVATKLSRMNPNNSPGPDGVAPIILKELQKIIAEPLYLIFTCLYLSLYIEKLPVGWKLELVSPIFKKGSRHQVKKLHASKPKISHL
jgi:hypothetical protein